MKWAMLAALFALPAVAQDGAPPTPPPVPRAVAVGDSSASRMMLGVRASFSGSSITTAGLGGAVSTLNGVLFLTDQLALVASFGFGIEATNNGNGTGTSTLVGFQFGGGVDFFFRGPAASLRPVIGGIISVFKNYSNIGGTVTNDGTGVGISLLGSAGLAYFFVPNFSVDARLAIALPIEFGNYVSVSLFTLTPGVGATVLF